MKRSELHQIVGALVVAGKSDLAKSMFMPTFQIKHLQAFTSSLHKNYKGVASFSQQLEDLMQSGVDENNKNQVSSGIKHLNSKLEDMITLAKSCSKMLDEFNKNIR